MGAGVCSHFFVFVEKKFFLFTADQDEQTRIALHNRIDALQQRFLVDCGAVKHLYLINTCESDF